MATVRPRLPAKPARLVAVHADDFIVRALQLLRESHVRAALVVDDGRHVGGVSSGNVVKDQVHLRGEPIGLV